MKGLCSSIEEVDDVQNGELHKLWLARYLSGPGLGHWNTVVTMTLRVTRLWNARGEQQPEQPTKDSVYNLLTNFVSLLPPEDGFYPASLPKIFQPSGTIP